MPQHGKMINHPCADFEDGVQYRQVAKLLEEKMGNR